jgi:hypothetical protein
MFLGEVRSAIIIRAMGKVVHFDFFSRYFIYPRYPTGRGKQRPYIIIDYTILVT